VNGTCTATLPADPLGACTVFEPSDLPGRSLVGAGAPVIVGGIYRLTDSSDKPTSNCPMLAARQISQGGGLNGGRPVGMVICDGLGNAMSDEERKQRMFTLVDYLAGTLGAPVIVGPTTSFDAINAVTRSIAQRYPTVMISPSATSVALTSIQDRLDEKDPQGLFWRTAPSDLLQTQVLVEQVVGKIPAPMMGTTVSKVAVLYIDDPYGEGLAKGFDEGWTKAKKGTTQLFAFKGGKSQDWNALAKDVAASAPHAMLMVSVDAVDTVGFVTASRAQKSISDLILYVTDGSKDATQLLNKMLPADVQQFITTKLIGTAPASPKNAAFNAFAAALNAEFKVNASDFAFTANGYDAGYVGAMGIVYASVDGNDYDGRKVAEGLARLVGGKPVAVGKTGWPEAVSELTTKNKKIDVQGISGELKFDANGEAPAPIEIWQPTSSSMDCGGKPPCIFTVKTVE
jgi:branched-chain amino acid transport system substrate-binding protein